MKHVGGAPLAIVAFALLLYPAPISATLQRPEQRSSLTVAVTDGQDGKSLANASVTLVAAPSMAAPDSAFSQLAVTGDEGTCAFVNVPSGLYIVRAAKTGYVTTPFGVTQDDDEPTLVAVQTGVATEAISISLPAGGAITGVVRQPNGEPAARVAVALMEPIGDGRRFAKPSSAAAVGAVVRTQTDDSGTYRLYGLPSGRYLVQATSIVPPKLGQTITDNPTLLRGYYPNSVDVAGAAAVALQTAQEVPNIDVQLQPLTLVNVSGVVLWQSDRPRPNFRLLAFPSGLFANLNDELDARFVVESPDGLYTNPVSIERDNSFVLRGVPPGVYELWLRSIAAEASPDDANPAVWGQAIIVVGNTEVSNVAIGLQSSAVVSGRIEVEPSGAAGDREKLTGGVVSLTPTEPPGVRSRALRVSATIEPDGRFRLVGVTPGRYTFDVLLRDRNWAVTSARTNERDLFETPIDVEANDSITDVVARVTNVQQLVSGRLLDGADRPVAGTRIVIFPADRRLWMSGSRRIRTVKTATDGTFLLNGVPAGEYRLGALTVALDPMKIDPAVLDAMSSSSVPFAIDRGARKVIDIRLVR